MQSPAFAIIHNSDALDSRQRNEVFSTLISDIIELVVSSSSSLIVSLCVSSSSLQKKKK
jgi:hypothetical protein